ncbi:TPA: hypothetical protein JRX32_003542 [Elizabethkingia anophelis]|nr:hypothetical protein [Elizabethkingia anophelis]HAY3548995.1 hypothetical protein [Elizabethkingia anophelis]HAY3593783.1 hypothetical protein [Elizabethkingia anophelis]
MKEFIIKQIIDASSLELEHKRFIVTRTTEIYRPEKMPRIGDNYSFNLYGKHIQCRVFLIEENEIFII